MRLAQSYCGELCQHLRLPRILTCQSSSSQRSRPTSTTPRWILVAAVLLAGFPGFGQTERLPLAVDGPAGALGFEAAGPPATVLTGLLLPSTGPLTAWAPVFSSLGADGALTEVQTGSWTGPRPKAWLKVVKPGFVVAGFRVLVRTNPEPVQTRQVQVFWKPWTDGAVSGPTVTSRAYGAAAGEKDQVRIVELTLPAGAIPTGLWGQILGGQVVQSSLTVRMPPAAPARAPTLGQALSPAAPPRSPGSTSGGPEAPHVPQVTLAKP